MGETNTPTKRPAVRVNNRERRKRKRRYQSSCEHVKVQDLGVGHRGVLVTCQPRHEGQCAQEANIMLAEVAEALDPTLRSRFDLAEEEKEDGGHTEGGGEAQGSLSRDEEGDTYGKVQADGIAGHRAEKSDSVGAGPRGGEEKEEREQNKCIGDQLDSELREIRKTKSLQSQRIFTRMDIGINGSVFLRIAKNINLEPAALVEQILRDARKYGSPNCRYCVRFVPVHSTCKATPEAAAEATSSVLKMVKPPGSTYCIQYKSRNNSSAHRADYIDTIAKVVDKSCKVRLEDPDWVLIVEVLKTSCCIGVFQPFFELGKLNVLECAKPVAEKGKGKLSETIERNSQKVGKSEAQGQMDSTISADMTNRRTEDPPAENGGIELHRGSGNLGDKSNLNSEKLKDLSAGDPGQTASEEKKDSGSPIMKSASAVVASVCTMQ